MIHSRPGSPKKPCKVTMRGEHQWVNKPRYKICWICGARS